MQYREAKGCYLQIVPQFFQSPTRVCICFSNYTSHQCLTPSLTHTHLAVSILHL